MFGFMSSPTRTRYFAMDFVESLNILKPPERVVNHSAFHCRAISPFFLTICARIAARLPQFKEERVDNIAPRSQKMGVGGIELKPNVRFQMKTRSNRLFTNTFIVCFVLCVVACLSQLYCIMFLVLVSVLVHASCSWSSFLFLFVHHVLGPRFCSCSCIIFLVPVSGAGSEYSIDDCGVVSLETLFCGWTAGINYSLTYAGKKGWPPSQPQGLSGFSDLAL